MNSKERLRALIGEDVTYIFDREALFWGAVDRIEELQAENAALRGALEALVGPGAMSAFFSGQRGAFGGSGGNTALARQTQGEG